MSRRHGVDHWGPLLESLDLTALPTWAEEMTTEARSRFMTTGFPRPKKDGWHHTNLIPLSRLAFGLPEPRETPPHALPRIDGALGRLVFVDGRLSPTLSDPIAVPGLTISSLREALRHEDAALRVGLTTSTATPNDGASDLATALLPVADGAFVHVSSGTQIDAPIHLVFVSTGAPDLQSTVIRNVVLAETHSSVTVVEHYVGDAPGSGDPPTLLQSVATDLVVRDGAHLDHVRLQEPIAGAHHLADLRTHQERDSHLRSFCFTFGGALTRTGIHAALRDTGTHCELLGLYFGRDREHVDHTTTIAHHHPHGTSRQVFKGILDDRARGVFTGTVYVGEGASQTHAEQENRNLLLAQGAHADSEPQLEIHNDDVRCSHGSAIGRLDEDALFYLRARGISSDEARGMLTRAFAEDILTELRHTGLREAIAARIGTWLTGRLGETS